MTGREPEPVTPADVEADAADQEQEPSVDPATAHNQLVVGLLAPKPDPILDRILGGGDDAA